MGATVLEQLANVVEHVSEHTQPRCETADASRVRSIALAVCPQQVRLLDSPDLDLHAGQRRRERHWPTEDSAPSGTRQRAPTTFQLKMGFRTTAKRPAVTSGVFSRSSTPMRQDARICICAANVTANPESATASPATLSSHGDGTRSGSMAPPICAAGATPPSTAPNVTRMPPHHSRDPAFPDRPRNPASPVERYCSHVRHPNATAANPT